MNGSLVAPPGATMLMKFRGRAVNAARAPAKAQSRLANCSAQASITKWLQALLQTTTYLGPHTAADGFVTRSSLDPIAPPVYVGDRVPFTAQRDATDDRLSISVPLVGPVTKKFSIDFNRRRIAPDGAFAGTASCAVDVAQLEDFFSSLDIGRSSIVALVGNDGVLRARGGREPAMRRLAGRSAPDAPLLHHLRQSPQGSYWNSPARATFEGTQKLMSYRQIAGVALVAPVGLAKADIVQHADAVLRKYVMAGAILTLMVLIGVMLGASR